MQLEKKKNNLIEGHSYIIDKISTNSLTKERFSDFGIEIGTKVICFKKSIMGYPIAFLCKGSIIYLNKNLINLIEFKKLEKKSKSGKNSCQKK